MSDSDCSVAILKVIDRITNAGQCEYYEVIVKVIKQGLWDLPLIKGRKTNRVL